MSHHRLAIAEILKHEGGFVDHPDDPGGATNKGVTIGTLKRLGLDVDGDGDSDLADLKALSDDDVHHVYKTFYWDAVQADLLPLGVGYVVADFAVNSGPNRAAKALQRSLGVAADGHVGPITVAAAHKADPVDLINQICDRRLNFMRQLRVWPTFKRGWTRRVDDVRFFGIALATEPPVAPEPKPKARSLFGRWFA